MPTLTTDERATFDRSNAPALAFVYICQPELVFEAPLTGVFYTNEAIVAVGFGTPTTGAFSDIKDGYTLEIWDSTHNAYGSQRVRGDATATAIPVGRSPQGTRPGELTAVSGATVRVYKERRIWTKNPFIASDGTQYKDELAYPGDNAAQPPVANAGPDLLILSDTGNETVTLDALGGVPSFAVRNGATLASYQWALDGGTVDTGTLTDSSLTAIFDYGEYDVGLTVTDSNGISHTCYKLVVVARPSECVSVQINTESVRPDGVQLSLTVDASDLPAAARPNARVLYIQLDSHADYGNARLAFSGWLAPEQHSLQDARRQRKQIQIECHDAGRRLRSLFGFPLTVSNESGTTGWYRMPDASIDRLTHHYLQWHTNVLDIADFAWSGQGDTYPLPRLTTQGLSIYDQANRLAQSIGYRMTCNRAGALRVVGDPNELPSSDQQNALATPTQRTSVEVTTLTPSDYGLHNFTANQLTSTYWLHAEAVVASAIVGNISPVKCSAPGLTPAQGTGSQDVTELLVTSQDELNVRMGNRYAARVNPALSPLTLTMVKTVQVFEPANMEWVRVVLPPDSRARYGFLQAAGNRFLIQEVVNTYDHSKVKRSTTMTLELEVVGSPAQTVIDPPSQGSQYPQWQEVDFVPLTIDTQLGSEQWGLVKGVGSMLLVSSAGFTSVTSDFSTPSWNGGPTWVQYDHRATLGNSIIQYAYRPDATNVSAWLLTPTAIWYAENLQSPTPIFTQQFTFRAQESNRNIDVDFINAPGQFALVASQYPDGVWVTVTTDGGATWSAETQLSARDAFPPLGVSISSVTPGSAWVAALDFDVFDFGSGDNPFNYAFIRRTSDFGQTFVELQNILDDDGLSRGLIVPIAGREQVAFSSFDVSNGLFTANPLNLDLGLYLIRMNLPDAGITNISPIYNGLSYGPRSNGRFTISVADNDVNKLIFAGRAREDDNFGVFGTANALSDNPSWITIREPLDEGFQRVAFVNNGSELYAFGRQSIAYSDNPYNPNAFDDRSGNLNRNDNVIGIAGF